MGTGDTNSCPLQVADGLEGTQQWLQETHECSDQGVMEGRCFCVGRSHKLLREGDARAESLR